MEVTTDLGLVTTKNEMLLKHLLEDLTLEGLLVFFIKVTLHFIGLASMVLEVSISVDLRSQQLQLLIVSCLLAFMIASMMAFGLLYDNVQVDSAILQQPLN